MSPRHTIDRLVIIMGLLLLCPGSASAQVARAAQERIRLLNSQAMEQYDVLEFDAAKELLEKAIAEAGKYDLVQDTSMARTHLNLGVVYGAGFNDRLNAVKHFTEALKLDANSALDPMRATPTLEEMFTSAKEDAAPPRKKDLTLRHTPLDDVPAGQVVTLKASLGGDLEAAEVVLVFWTSAAPRRNRLPMSQVQPGIYQGQIPAAAVRGKSIYYFIEAQDDLGKRVQGHGSKGSPNIISVRGGGGPNIKPPPGGGEEPKSDDKTVSVYVMVGTGVGVIHGGESENTHPVAKTLDAQGNAKTIEYKPMEIKPGGALAPLHVAAELAYHLNKKWHIGALARIQFVNAISSKPANTQELMASRVSVLGLLRARRFFLEGPLKLYVAFGAGGGQIRHRVELGNYDVDENTGKDPTKAENDRVDARLSQYVAFNVGGGLKYMFHPNIGVALDLSGIILVPDFAAHLDINLGPVISF